MRDRETREISQDIFAIFANFGCFAISLCMSQQYYN